MRFDCSRPLISVFFFLLIGLSSLSLFGAEEVAQGYGTSVQDHLPADRQVPLSVSVDPGSGHVAVILPVGASLPVAAELSLGLHAVYAYDHFDKVYSEDKTQAWGTWASKTHQAYGYNKMKNHIAYGWQWAEVPLLYKHRDVRPVWYYGYHETVSEYYELVEAANTYRFYTATPTPEGGYWDADQAGIYAPYIWDEMLGCEPCEADGDSSGKLLMYTRDGSNLRLTIYPDDNRALIEYPDGHFREFAMQDEPTGYYPYEYPAEGDAYQDEAENLMPALRGSDTFGNVKDDYGYIYRYNLLSSPYYLRTGCILGSGATALYLLPPDFALRRSGRPLHHLRLQPRRKR